ATRATPAVTGGTELRPAAAKSTAIAATRSTAASPTDDASASRSVAWASCANTGTVMADATTHVTAAPRTLERIAGTPRARPRTKAPNMAAPAATSPEP